MTLEEAIAQLRAAGIDSPRTDARLLFEFAKEEKNSLSPSGGEGRGEGASPRATPSKFSRAAGAKFASNQDGAAPPPHPSPLPQRGRGNFHDLIARRAAREPLAYITGRREFWSLEFAVGPGVLIPRPDTETLIETLIRIRPDRAAPLSILDLGTGSGCLLIAALAEYPNATGAGIDSSPDALRWAKANLAAHALEARAALIETAWPEEASPGFDVILSNPPYIPSAQIETLEPDVRLYEPRAALDGGADGLDAYRALAPRIARLLKPSGVAILELGQGQGPAVSALMTAAGLEVPEITPDLAAIPRALVAKPSRLPI